MTRRIHYVLEPCAFFLMLVKKREQQNMANKAEYETGAVTVASTFVFFVYFSRFGTAASACVFLQQVVGIRTDAVTVASAPLFSTYFLVL